MTEETLFAAALDAPTPAARAAVLDRACAADAALRRRVEALLASHDRADFLGTPAIERAALALGNRPLTADAAGPPPADRAGVVLAGRYKLLEAIGEGGMGTVWLAEQTEPVRRTVAVKLIKPGMDSKQVLARFAAERQALALMDHPNIAKVLEAGAAADGRPFFVLELVKGVPITKYCDEHRLTPRERLELFVPVCHAIQHAHQKGIIHRDLKPSNVLVARYDDRPVPKVIDFGVAKAVGQQLTEQTLHTGFWSVVGTLEYMSPEQASFNQLDIDTRSDVYSLAILLYELLTGTTPLERGRARDAGMLEALRIIREEEAPTLSNRLNTTAELPVIAARRALEPAKLTRLVSGDLDWIVMKALDKDRNRRYETATALAADVQRYLADEPVQACPPSAGYRLRKFARRNKGPVLALAAIFLLLIAGIGGTTWGLVRAEQAREAEADQRRLAEAAVVSERAAKEAEAEQRNRATEAARKATREAAVAAATLDFLNKDILQLSSPSGQALNGVSPDANLKLRTVLQRAATRIDGKFPNEPEVEMSLRYTIGYALQSVGDYTGALGQYEKVVPRARQLLGPDDRYTLMAEYRVASTHTLLRHFDVAVPLLEENVERHRAALPEGHPQTFLAMNGLAMAYGADGQLDKGLRLAEQTLELRKRHLAPTHGDILVSMNNLASLRLRSNRVDQALPLFEEALAGMTAKFGPLHPERLNTTRNLGHAYLTAERPDKAMPLLELAQRQYQTANGRDDPATQGCIDALIGCYVDLGQCDKAATLLASIQAGGDNRPAVVSQGQAARERRHGDLIRRVKPAADGYQQQLAAKGADHPDTLAARQALAIALRDQNRLRSAAYHLTAVLDARQRLPGADRPDTLASRLELGATRLQQKRYAEAEPLLLEAYAGLRRQETKVAGPDRRATEAVERLVQLYESWEKNDKAMEWRQKLAAPKR